MDGLTGLLATRIPTYRVAIKSGTAPVRADVSADADADAVAPAPVELVKVGAVTYSFEPKVLTLRDTGPGTAFEPRSRIQDELMHIGKPYVPVATLVAPSGEILTNRFLEALESKDVAQRTAYVKGSGVEIAEVMDSLSEADSRFYERAGLVPEQIAFYKNGIGDRVETFFKFMNALNEAREAGDSRQEAAVKTELLTFIRSELGADAVSGATVIPIEAGFHVVETRAVESGGTEREIMDTSAELLEASAADNFASVLAKMVDRANSELVVQIAPHVFAPPADLEAHVLDLVAGAIAKVSPAFREFVGREQAFLGLEPASIASVEPVFSGGVPGMEATVYAADVAAVATSVPVSRMAAAAA